MPLTSILLGAELATELELGAVDELLTTITLELDGTVLELDITTLELDFMELELGAKELEITITALEDDTVAIELLEAGGVELGAAEETATDELWGALLDDVDGSSPTHALRVIAIAEQANSLLAELAKSLEAVVRGFMVLAPPKKFCELRC